MKPLWIEGFKGLLVCYITGPAAISGVHFAFAGDTEKPMEGGGNFDEWLPILSPGCLVCLTEFFDEYERELVLRAVVPQPLRERQDPIHAYVR